MGEPAFLSEEFSGSRKLADPDLELVTTSGHGKNGALCVLQRSIRPQVVTTFELPGCNDIWTVKGESSSSSTGGFQDGHSFLILSRSDSTMILQTGEEINELDHSGFFTHEPTVLTCNIGDQKYIAQVTRRQVRLLKGSELLQELELNLESNIIRASCADPYILLLTEEGQLVLLTLDLLGMPKLTITKTNLKSKSPLINICAYKDTSGVFVAKPPKEYESFMAARSSGGAGGVKSSYSASAAPISVTDIDDDDALLYGDTGLSSTAASSFNTGSSSKSSEEEPFWRKHARAPKPSWWAVLYRENGSLEFLTIPDFVPKYVIEKLPFGEDVLKDRNLSNKTKETSSQNASSFGLDSTPRITEILMTGLGYHGNRPVLMARLSDHELLVYEAYSSYESYSSSHSNYYGQNESPTLLLCFKKLKHGLILRERRGKSKREVDPSKVQNSLRRFSNIAGYDGVFVCGPYPHWLILTSRGELRTHPMSIDGPVPCFAAFHNVNCPQGFIYFNKKGELRICVLPTHLSYDAHWPVRKVPLRRTPHFITYHLESKTYGLVTSTSEPTNQVWKFNGDDKELATETRSDRFPWPTKETFQLQLFSPVSWEEIPGTKEELQEWERCTAMKHLYLSHEGMHSGQKGYIVMATAFKYGEDVTPRGYIRIYDVIEVIPEPGQPLTKNKMKVVYDKEQKGPVTAISAVNGYLVATLGQKVYIFQFKNKELYGVAFIDSKVYVHSLACLKNFILVGDIMQSVDLLMFQQDYRTLAVVSKDTKDLEVYAVEFVVDDSNVAFIVSDADKNVVLFHYAPEARESLGGQRLLRRADFQYGQPINCFFRVRAKIVDPTSSGRVIMGWEKRHVTWFASLDGAFGFVLPTAEKTYRRLQMLSSVLSQSLPHAAGLNPKAAKSLKATWKRELQNPTRGVVDGDLVYAFSDLPAQRRHEIAKRIGTKAPDILDDLAELHRMSAHF